MKTHLHCIAALRRRPTDYSVTGLRRWLAAHLRCSPFCVRVGVERPAGPGLLFHAGVPTDVLSGRPARHTGLYLRQFPDHIDAAQRSLVLAMLNRALIGVFEERLESETHRVFLGRPLVVAAERTPVFVKLYRFSRTDWDAFTFTRPVDRERSYQVYSFSQSVLADLLRLYGCSVRMELAKGFEVVLGDSVSL